MERAPGRPSAQTSTLKPSGTLSLSSGSSFADFPVTSIANGCRVDFSCSALRPCCQEGGAAVAADAICPGPAGGRGTGWWVGGREDGGGGVGGKRVALVFPGVFCT